MTLLAAGVRRFNLGRSRRIDGVTGETVLVTLSVVVILMLIAFVAVPGVVAPKSPIALDILHRLQPPSFTHPFGTDEGGRDVSIATVLCAAVFGVLYGALSGMGPRWLDNILMRIVDVFFGFPALVLALAVAAALGRGLLSVTIALGAIWWPGFARLVRGEVQRIRERPHVEAARAIGVSTPALVRRHILPFVMQEVNVRLTTDIGYALVAVTALSFLGLGAQSPTPEWGLLIRDSRSYFGTAWWYLVFPGVMIMVTTAACSILGDWLAARRGRGSQP